MSLEARVTDALDPAPPRRTELDELRVLVVVGLIFFHAALVFAADDDFYVKDAHASQLPTILAGVGVVWAMPLLFLVAGISAAYSLRRRGARRFVVERLRRLGVPLVFATVVLAPLPQWLRQRAADPAFDQSYPEFLPRFFDVRLRWSEFPFVLQGEHFETGHLWFVVLLLAFCLPLALVAALAGHQRLRGVVVRIGRSLSGVAHRRGAVLAPALAPAALSALLGLEQEYAAWSRWAYGLFFLGGVAVAASAGLRAAVRRAAPLAAGAGLLLLAIGMPLFLVVGVEETFTATNPAAVGARALYGAAGWCLVVAIAGLLDRHPSASRRGGDTPEAGTPRRSGSGALRRTLRHFTPATLPLYVLHQPVVVVVAYGLLGWGIPAVVKYPVIVVISLVVTVAGYELLVRRTPVTRFLFGMR